MNQERDEFLMQVMGLCWHKVKINWDTRKFGQKHYCLKCGTEYDDCHKPIDFSTWDGYGLLWEWFLAQSGGFGNAKANELNSSYLSFIPRSWLHPDNFADMLYEHLRDDGRSEFERYEDISA